MLFKTFLRPQQYNLRPKKVITISLRENTQFYCEANTKLSWHFHFFFFNFANITYITLNNMYVGTIQNNNNS